MHQSAFVPKDRGFLHSREDVGTAEGLSRFLDSVFLGVGYFWLKASAGWDLVGSMAG